MPRNRLDEGGKCLALQYRLLMEHFVGEKCGLRQSQKYLAGVVRVH